MSRKLIALTAGAALGLTGLGHFAASADVESDTDCSADYSDESENDLGSSEQDGGLLSVLQLGSVGLQGTLLGTLNNLLCGSNLLNGLDLNILSESDDDDEDEVSSETDCSADFDDDSESSIGDADQDLGILNVLGLNSLGLQRTLLGSLNNLGCGANILNNLDVNILGRS